MKYTTGQLTWVCKFTYSEVNNNQNVTEVESCFGANVSVSVVAVYKQNSTNHTPFKSILYPVKNYILIKSNNLADQRILLCIFRLIF